MPLLQQIVDSLNQLAPPSLAESWDNVGLLVGDQSTEVVNVMLTIDYTPAVAAEAAAKGSELVIAYHPPIFLPIKKLLAGSVVFDAIRRGMAIYSPHTALDAAEGGTNDVLADVLGLKDRGPLKQTAPAHMQYKLDTFVPAHAVESVSAALFAAGAGRIGDYSSCSFRSPGVGTFFGEKGSNPSIGQSGRLETAEEISVETVVPIEKVDAVVAALRKAHPYEEPAFDLVVLAAAPTTDGIGRVGVLSPPMERATLFAAIKKELGIGHLLIAGPTEGVVSKAAVCAGSGTSFIDAAIAAKVDLYLTGEIKHHDALKAAAAGVTVVATLHSNSERITLKRLAERLTASHPAVAFHLSQQDGDPFSVR